VPQGVKALSGITAFALQKQLAGSIMARCLELGERRWVGIVTMSAKKLSLEASLRPVGRPRKPIAKKTEKMTPLFGWP
jgi:hypothetical protein